MWRMRDSRSKRIDQLAENKAQIGEIRKDLDGLLNFFAGQGARVESAAADAVDGVPPGLISASRTTAPRPGGEPVKVTTREGREVIALIGPGGDPAEIWHAINELAR